MNKEKTVTFANRLFIYITKYSPQQQGKMTVILSMIHFPFISFLYNIYTVVCVCGYYKV